MHARVPALSQVLRETELGPLAGRVWDGSGRRLLEPDETTCHFHAWEQLLSHGSRQSFNLLGEVHDNALHHKLRAAFVSDQFRNWPGVLPAVVFEQFRTDQQPVLDAFMARPKEERTLDAFLAAVEWDKSGWAKYDYRPLFEAVLAAGLPIYAGDAPRDLIRKAAKEGPAALPPNDLKQLALDQPLGERQHDAMLTEIEQSHCGLMPKSAFEGMAFAQRLRDATIADVALKAREKHGGVLVIAGNGHVRSDRGVGWYIRQRAPDTKLTTTQLVEVEDGKIHPETYVPRDPDGKPAADYLIFTPRAARPDPCEQMKKQFQKKP